MQESEYFTQEISLDINYSSRFVRYPHYPIACCLPHLSMVAHNCHVKSINLTAKRIASPCGKKKKTRDKKKKTRGKKKNLTAKRKRKRLKAKRKPHGKIKKTRGKISSIPRGHFNSYFFALRSWLFFLPWGYSFCREVFLYTLKVNSFAVTVLGHRTFEILFPKILDFSTDVGICEN